MAYREKFEMCSIWGCGNELAWRTLCAGHRAELPSECVIEACEKRTASRGLCGMHVYRLRANGDPGIVKRHDTGGVLVHGTVAGYKHHGCRCDRCRESRRTYERRWRGKNPEYARSASRRSRMRDPERARQYRRSWKQRNPEKVPTSSPLRAAAPFDEEAVGYSNVIINDPCVYCGGKSEQIDHVHPLRDGGDSHWSNLAPTCASCNGTKGAKSVLDFLLYRAAA